MDSTIERHAKKGNKTILGLEKPNSDYVCKVLDNMYNNAQAVIAFFENGNNSVFEKLYMEGKLSFIMLTDGTEGGLVAERNLEWFPRLQESHSQHDGMLTCVGLAHLFLENGLLRLLLKGGYSLQTMSLDGSNWTDFTEEDIVRIEREGLYNDVKFCTGDVQFTLEQLEIIAGIAHENGDTQVEESIKALLANLSIPQVLVANTQAHVTGALPGGAEEDVDSTCNIRSLFDDAIIV